jgi:D-sedoheptulose 7-phosphate isomerase
MSIDMAKACDDIRSISLTDNVPAITAWANDTSYVEVFSRQLKNLSVSGDLVIGISASGSSPNIVEAIKTAQNKDCKTVVLTGNAGLGQQRPLHSLADHSIIVDSPVYGIVEDVHCAINHILFHYLQERQ